MLKTSTAIAALAVLFSASQVLSADLGRGLKDGTDVAQDVPDGRGAFIGLGVGIHGGGQFTNVDVVDTFDGIGADGLVGGVHAEYLFPLGRFRVGPYVEGGLSNVNTEYGGYDLLKQDSYFGGGIKAGVIAYGASLISGHVGYEWAQWSSDFISGDINVGSLVLGGGVETMIAHNVSIGLTADYLIPLDVSAGGTDVTDYVEESESLRVLARITYRQ